MSADEIKNTPDVEAVAAPEKDAAKAAGEVKKPAAKKAAAKPATKKPVAKKPAAKAAPKKAATKKAAPKKAAAEAATSKPSTKKAAPVKPATKKAAPVKPIKRASVERPAKLKADKKAPPETRHGGFGVATVVDASGKELETRDLSKDLFAVPANVNTLHLVVRAEQAARRRGSASSKTRGEVRGSTAKLYRQKGTGRARAGSFQSPLWRGGGVVFGPMPRSYAKGMPRKMARLAFCAAFSGRVRDGEVRVLETLTLEAPKTKTLAAVVKSLGLKRGALLIVDKPDRKLLLAVRNLPDVTLTTPNEVNTYQLLRWPVVVITKAALETLRTRLAAGAGEGKAA